MDGSAELEIKNNTWRINAEKTIKRLALWAFGVLFLIEIFVILYYSSDLIVNDP